jgi:uncharacterized protein YfaS (alpha-2-macroglobulin family)
MIYCRRVVLPALLIAAMPALAGTLRARAEPQPSLADADGLYRKQKYEHAAIAYERLLAASALPATRRDEAQYRLSVSLGKSGQWDAALARSIEFVKSHRGTAWEPRGLYWLGRLYLAVPHFGHWEKATLHRGQIRDSNLDVEPERVDLEERDLRNGRDALEAARVFFPAYRRQYATAAEEIQLDFDLARVLYRADFHRWAEKRQWAPPDDLRWRVTGAETYSPEWPPPKKQIFLYEHVRRLAAELGRPGVEPRALLGEWLWWDRYRGEMRYRYAVRRAGRKEVRIPYPYQERQADDSLHELIRAFPSDPLRDLAQYLLAEERENARDFRGAVAAYRQLIQERPNGRWTDDARARIQAITGSELSLASVAPQRGQLPGRPARLRLTARNVGQVQLAAYRVPLRLLFDPPGRNTDPHQDFFDFLSPFRTLARLRQRCGPPVARWRVVMIDRGDHQERTRQVATPPLQTGAYVIIASVPRLEAAVALLISDLVVVQRSYRDRVLLFAADARSGRPVAGARVVARREWHDGRGSHGGTARGVTDAKGLLNIESRAFGPDNRTGWGTLVIFSYLGNRYAVARARWSAWSLERSQERAKVFALTDRAVYRPGQTVHYRQIVMGLDALSAGVAAAAAAPLAPLANRPVQIEIYASNERLFETRAITNRFGSVSGDFTLPDGAPLGVYNLQCTVSGAPAAPNPRRAAGAVLGWGGCAFRVEEYKKPEFQVTVTPVAERVRPGETASARVAVEYYFGGPVAQARVSYRVVRLPYMQGYRFSRPFDFLRPNVESLDYERDYRDGEVVVQGTTYTDAQGQAEVTFSTNMEGSRWRGRDATYTVEADVQDASRRVITAVGEVRATRRDVAVFLNFPRGYATRGQPVELEVATRSATDQPVAVRGLARVFWSPDAQRGSETLAYETPLATDQKGRATLRWTPDVGGRFRVLFAARDRDGQGVSGSIRIWVQGAELEQGRFRFRGLYLGVQEPVYAVGQTAKALLVTPAPDCTVLLLREAGGMLLERRFVQVAGRSRELALPLGPLDAPNVHLTALLVRDGEYYQATSEIVMPPAGQFATVTVAADKERYQPGEKARLRLEARDRQGKPVQAEISLAVTDAALDYIAKAELLDIRAFFHTDFRAAISSWETSTPQWVEFGARQEDRQPIRRYATHGWHLPDGMGQLSNWQGENDDFRREGYYGDLQEWVFTPDSQWARLYPDGLPSPAGGSAGAPAPLPKPPVSMGGRIDPERQLSSLGAAPSGIPEARQDLDRLEARVRRRFLDTAFWAPAVVTDAAGCATVEVSLPDNLTRWRAVALGATESGQVGSGEAAAQTSRDLVVRLQAPRFFVERDEVVLSANVHNHLPRDVQARIRLELGGDEAEVVGDQPARGYPTTNDQRGGAEVGSWLSIPREGEARVDWTLRVRREGSLRLRVTAETGADADGAETTVPVLVHGVQRLVAQSGMMRDREEEGVHIDLPPDRKPGSAMLVVRLTPSLAATILDALPYLADYPYGCTEQTMSRFLPSVVVAKTLRETGYDLEDLAARARRQEERRREELHGPTARAARGPALHTPYSYPLGLSGGSRPPNWGSGGHWACRGVFDRHELDERVNAGLTRLRRLQHRDGGWGWWPDDSSDPYMTAYVIEGLQLCRAAGMPVPPRAFDRGLQFLRLRFPKEKDPQQQAYEAFVLSREPDVREPTRPAAAGPLYAGRERLSPYTRALLALALHALGEAEKATTLLQEIEAAARRSPTGSTVSWERPARDWWRWYHDPVETHAAVLEAYLAIRPEQPADRGMPAMLVRWLVDNRTGARWSSTRDTARAVLALADTLRVTRELQPEYTVHLDLEGRAQCDCTVTRQNALLFDDVFIVPDALLRTGAQTLTIRKVGAGTLYWAAYTQYLSATEPLRASGDDLRVDRRYFRVLPALPGEREVSPLEDPRPNPFLTGEYERLAEAGAGPAGEQSSHGASGGQDGSVRRVPLREGEEVASGDVLEVELNLAAKEAYEYLVFEDPKPAGCEPVELHSGDRYGGGLSSHVELRDQKIVFFVSQLPAGRRRLTYRLRAEIPGRFSVLPAHGYAMYAPAIRTLSDERPLIIRDPVARE